MKITCNFLLAILSLPFLLGSVVRADDTPSAKETPASSIVLKPAAEWSWFEAQPIKYTADNLPSEVQAIKGTVFDSSGSKIAEVTVNRDDFLRDGWVWEAPALGLYNISFASVEADGARPLTRSWIRHDSKSSPTLTKDFYTAAVVKAGTWAVRSSEFGFDNQAGATPEEEKIRMGAKVGFGFGRKWIFWGGNGWEIGKSVLNPAAGVYHWDELDHDWALYKHYGYHDNLALIWGTPQWASTHPELTDIDVCVRRYSEYPPADMNTFRDFVGAMVDRYGADIKDWEIWNEQHFPQSTCYWKGSPEDYVELLKTAYETIKSKQPQSTVWLGGMAPRRYLPFYQEFLKDGGYSYYDTYSSHGHGQEIELIHKADEAAGFKSKPWNSSEWHAFLLNATDPVPSETVLCRNMMTDLFQQLKNGVGRISMFELDDLDELEYFPFAKAEGVFTHCSGLFRRMPAHEPRLAAVVLHDFLTRVTDRIDYLGEYDLGQEKAVLLTTGGEPLLVVWNEGENPMKLDSRLAKALSPASVATDWAGRSWTGDILDTTGMVYFTGVDPAVLAALKVPATALLYSWQRKKIASFQNVATGPLSPDPLFAKVEDEPNPQAAWISDNLVFKGLNGNSRPAGFSARFAAYAGKTGLDLAVDVKDAKFFQNSPVGEAYNGDSVQFAVDSEGNGGKENITQFTVSLMPDGPVVWKDLAAFIGGDLPGDTRTPAGRRAKNASADVKKTSDGLLYKVHVDWGEFYPYSYNPQKPMRFSLLVNDNDGAGRLGWLEWSGGIGELNDAALFGKLQLGLESQPPAPNLFGNDSFSHDKKIWSPEIPSTATSEYIPRIEDTLSSLKIIVPDVVEAAWAHSAPIPVTGGATYHFTVRVRGQGNLKCHWILFDGQKKQLSTDMTTISGSGGLDLTSDWQLIEKDLVIPQGTTSCTFNFLFYKSSGMFELTDAHLEKE